MSEIRSRASKASKKVTGVSVPFFGLQWEPGVSDAKVAESVIVFMEDRRVLYNPWGAEDGNACVTSVVQIREELTKAIQNSGINATMLKQFREMRAACRRFLDQLSLNADVGEDFVVEAFVKIHGGGETWVNTMGDLRFNQALGELRAVFGERLEAIATKYGITVEDDLAMSFPYPAD
jgi:hypothetical protein